MLKDTMVVFAFIYYLYFQTTSQWKAGHEWLAIFSAIFIVALSGLWVSLIIDYIKEKKENKKILA